MHSHSHTHEGRLIQYSGNYLVTAFIHASQSRKPASRSRPKPGNRPRRVGPKDFIGRIARHSGFSGVRRGNQGSVTLLADTIHNFKVEVWAVVILAVLGTMHILVTYFDLFEFLRKLHGG